MRFPTFKYKCSSIVDPRIHHFLNNLFLLLGLLPFVQQLLHRLPEFVIINIGTVLGIITASKSFDNRSDFASFEVAVVGMLQIDWTEAVKVELMAEVVLSWRK